MAISTNNDFKHEAKTTYEKVITQNILIIYGKILFFHKIVNSLNTVFDSFIIDKISEQLNIFQEQHDLELIKPID